MKNILNRNLIVLVAGFLLYLSACTEGFEELNTDPNQPVAVPTSSLLTGAQRELVADIFGNHDQLDGVGLPAMVYVQQMASLRGGTTDTYATVEEDFSTFYTRGLRDLQEIIALNSNVETMTNAALSGPNNNQIAVARILKAWAFQNITDVWGDIPYTETLQGNDFPLPIYDTQEFIYMDLLKELTEAAEMITTSDGDISGDIIYDGDMDKWFKFANSLKMRVALRLSKVAPGVAANSLSEAVAAGPMTSTEDNAFYQFLESQPNNNPWFFRFELSVPNYGVGSTMVDMLKSLNDPRLEKYADVAFNQDLGGGYIGQPVGLDVASGSAISDFAVSWPDAQNILQPNSIFTIMSYAEVGFILAEAAERGWISGNASDYYNTAITASMDQWGITDPAAIASYLAQDNVAYDTSDPIKSIGNQKWIAFYMQGVQSWCEWRRLQVPELEIAKDAVIDGIPRRRGYPPSEINLNKSNYEAAVARQGTDDLLTRVWWDN
ncbi:SusD/RagB family nutrient-binding outer membrane lipoprotein [Cyclobacterium jeungdonense]|uniref:SusD/RagB family nutrient-binding outer membrane lipoprotein n=1 Tax=Cyclobacterium jeungdonense TaxID=708087 RepID=A0ABT8CA93_9BACT|nr:SusD/RagB family nutrient-binding outer membrane lipoprotein [Cyclobacterium jeungdonense]MDN3689704.1 SusD/RagB family nutrient-binding outer membrane lipoprotein [Cyclobacterium jeungdonense]